MKLICVVVVLILVGFQMSCGEELKCSFRDNIYHIVGTLYECQVTTLNNEFNNVTITGNSGIHLLINKNNNDVKAIFIYETNTKFIPATLGSVFKLKGLVIYRSKLIEIKSTDFQGMQELEYLDLGQNQLTEFPIDVFSTLPKLRMISFQVNQFQELPRGLFDNNLNLEIILLNYNQIKFIASGIFDNLKILNEVNLSGNICLNREYKGSTEITQLKQDITANCKDPNPITTTTTTTRPTTTTEDPMLIKDIEMQERIQILEKELTELQMELSNRTSEVHELKDQIIELQKQMMTQLMNAIGQQEKLQQLTNKCSTVEVTTMKEW